MKKRFFYLLLPIVTIVLEILPYGAVLNFANPEGEPWRETYSYFSLVPYGYANFAPLITAIITCIIFVILLIYCITGKSRMAINARNLLCVCAIISLGPLMFGIRNFSVVGALITISLVAELLLIHFTIKEAGEADAFICSANDGYWTIKGLEKALTEQILDMKINDIDTCEVEMLPIYFDGTEEDYSRWMELLSTAISSAKVFEIHCWNEEIEWIDFALKYGSLKESDWKYGKIITGEVTPEFVNMLLGMPKPQDTEIYNKITPFFNVFLDDVFQSSHYGTEVYIRES